jgi:hypothetical protein
MIGNSKPTAQTAVDLFSQSRQRSSPYPRSTLQQVEEFARAVFDLGARNCDRERVAQKVGYKSITSGSYTRLQSTATQFGLIKIEKNSVLSVTDEWVEVFHHSEDLQLIKAARKSAFLVPKLYQQLVEKYTEHQLPSLDKLSRELYLNQKYGILKDAAEAAARIFLESASYAGLLNEREYLIIDQDRNKSQIDKEINQPELKEEETIKESEIPIENKPPQNQGNLLPEILPELEGLEKYEITLTNRKKAYIYVPVPLPYGEKKRLQQYIDLILEEPLTSPSANYQESD